MLAQARDWLERQPLYLKLFKPVYSLLLLTTIFVINRYSGYTLVSVFGSSLTNISLAILVHRSVFNPTDLFGRFLNWKPIVGVGVLSYSLYLWQQPFLNRYSTASANAFPLNIILAVAVGLTSYFLLEMPLLKLRHRLRS